MKNFKTLKKTVVEQKPEKLLFYAVNKELTWELNRTISQANAKEKKFLLLIGKVFDLYRLTL